MGTKDYCDWIEICYPKKNIDNICSEIARDINKNTLKTFKHYFTANARRRTLGMHRPQTQEYIGAGSHPHVPEVHADPTGVQRFLHTYQWPIAGGVIFAAGWLSRKVWNYSKQ